jgi:hypothetical protein
MDKSKLDGFIKRYNLEGCIESVKVTSTKSENILETSFISEEKHVLGVVKLNDSNFGDCELGIYNTAKLKQLLGVLGSEIEVEPVSRNDKFSALKFSDKNMTAQFMLADLSVIPKVPKMKKLPTWDIVLNLDKDFIARFIKAKNALREVNTFTLLMGEKSKKLEMVIGYSSINSDRVSLDITPEKGKDKVKEPISFSAKYFKEILSVNSDATDATLNISTQGLAHISFSNDDFESSYYLTQVPQSD